MDIVADRYIEENPGTKLFFLYLFVICGDCDTVRPLLYIADRRNIRTYDGTHLGKYENDRKDPGFSSL